MLAQNRPLPADQRQPRLGRGDIGFGLLDAGGQRGGLAGGPGSGLRGAHSVVFQLFGPLLRRFAVRQRPDQRGPRFPRIVISGIALRRRPARQREQKKGGEGPEAKTGGIGLSRPVIGVPGQNRRGAEQLFHQHRAGEQMRPGRLAECEQQIGLSPRGIAMAIVRAEHEARFAHAFVTPAAQQMGELFG